MKHRTTILATALAVTLMGACSAKAATIGVDLVSIHIPQESYLSGLNPGAYVRFDNGATLGAYRNSFGRLSLWAGYTASYGPFALTAGVISGYQLQRTSVACSEAQTAAHKVNCWTERGNTHGAIGPLLAPSFALPSAYGVTTRLTLLPKFSAKGHTVLHLSTEF